MNELQCLDREREWKSEGEDLDIIDSKTYEVTT